MASAQQPVRDKVMALADLHSRLKATGYPAEWIVVVYPTAAVASEVLRGLGGLLPTGAQVAGRTALLANRGKVSVVAAEDPVFNGGFRVMFLGWTEPGKEFTGMASWRTAAQGVL